MPSILIRLNLRHSSSPIFPKTCPQTSNPTLSNDLCDLVSTNKNPTFSPIWRIASLLLQEPPMSSLLLNPNRAFFPLSRQVLEASFSSLCSISNARIPLGSRPTAHRVVGFKPRASRDSFDAEALPESNTKKKSRNNNKKIILFGSTPPPLSEERGGSAGNASGKPAAEGSSWVFLQRAFKRVLAVLSNLPLAIGEMFTIAALMALGMWATATTLIRPFFFALYWWIIPS